MQVNDIISSFNMLAEKLFLAVDSKIYDVLDKIVIIGPDILKEEPIKKIYSSGIDIIISIANSLILFYIIHFLILTLISMYNGKETINPYKFVARLIIILILVNNSKFLCEQILTVTYYFTEAICQFGNEVTKTEINFNNLKENILSADGILNSDFLSLDGIIKGIISFGIINILINFSVRYVTILILIIIFPIGIMMASTSLTMGIFKNYIKTFVVNLFVQVLTCILITIPLAFKDTKNIMFKIILVGVIYLLYKVTYFTKEIFSKITGNSINKV